MAKIKDIHIVGTTAFSETTLPDLLDLTTTAAGSPGTPESDRYSRGKLKPISRSSAPTTSTGIPNFDRVDAGHDLSGQARSRSTSWSKKANPYTAGVRLEGEYLGSKEDFKPS